ncbi:MAG: hypothetical protein WBE26_18340 [Phycisphaerae bacterium]
MPELASSRRMSRGLEARADVREPRALARADVREPRALARADVQRMTNSEVRIAK